MISPEELRKRMRPDHLTVEEQREEVAKKAEEAKPKKEDKPNDDDPRTQRVYVFDFEWRDGTGKVWRGKFENTVPDIQTRQLIGVLRSQLGNNVPFDALDPTVREMNLVIAHLSFSLTKRPKWADDLGTLYSFELLQRIYEEVATHEAIFLGYGQTAATG